MACRLNDPFGSWVYWNRIPLAAVDRVEVVRGATGDLYGAGALGGVIQLLTVQPSRTRARATFDGGSHDTFRGSLFAAAEKNGWNASGAYEGVRTDGVFVLALRSARRGRHARRQRLQDRLCDRSASAATTGTSTRAAPAIPKIAATAPSSRSTRPTGSSSRSMPAASSAAACSSSTASAARRIITRRSRRSRPAARTERLTFEQFIDTVASRRQRAVDAADRQADDDRRRAITGTRTRCRTSFVTRW